MKQRARALCLSACVVIPLLLTLREVVCVGSSAAGQDRGSLVAQALRARQLGKASLSLGVTLDTSIDERFDSIKSALSFFIATKTAKPPVQAADPDFIYTWHTLHLERVLSATCSSAPSVPAER